LGDVVGGVGVAVAHRLGRPGGGVLGRLQLHLGVQLGPDQDHEGGEEQPEHQDDDPGQGPVGLVVVAEEVGIEGEPEVGFAATLGEPGVREGVPKLVRVQPR
jgi:hypothetical protein